jgi:hypothetical protein
MEDDVSLDGCDSFKLLACPTSKLEENEWKQIRHTKNIPDPSIEWASRLRVVWVILQEEIDFRICGSWQHK